MIDTEQQYEDYRLLKNCLAGFEDCYGVNVYPGSKETERMSKVLARWTCSDAPPKLKKYIYTGDLGELYGNRTISPDLLKSGNLFDTTGVKSSACSFPINLRKADLRSQVIEYGVHPSPFGSCLIGITGESLCYLCFIDDPQEVTTACSEWKAGAFRYSHRNTLEFATLIFGAPDGNCEEIDILADGTDFQFEVWKALTMVPSGKVVSYSGVAGAINRPDAVRAVASAIAANPVSYLIPCHRVVRNNGHVHNYRWGSTRKRLMIAWEAGRAGIV